MTLDTDQLTRNAEGDWPPEGADLFPHGPERQTAYTKRVIAAIEAAGFADIAVMPPAQSGQEGAGAATLTAPCDTQFSLNEILIWAGAAIGWPSFVIGVKRHFANAFIAEAAKP